MKSKVYATFDEATADIPDGSTIMFPGFSAPGMPRNLIAALLRQGAKNLTGISNNHGRVGNLMDVGRLIEAGRVKKMICAFTAAARPSQVLAFEKLYEAGEIEAELVPQGTLAERIRAAAAGIGAFYTPTSVGTELAEGKEHRVIDGREYVLEYPLHADYAFIRAYRADSWGQPSISPDPAQLQPHNGPGRQNNHRRSGRGYSGARRPRSRPRAYARYLRRPNRPDPSSSRGNLGNCGAVT